MNIPGTIHHQICADTCRTKGGAGGPTTTVSTLPQLSAAASVEGARVIIVQGAIVGASKVSVTSDKTIVGKAGSFISMTIHARLHAPHVEKTLTLASSYWHWPHHSRSEKRNR